MTGSSVLVREITYLTTSRNRWIVGRVEVGGSCVGSPRLQVASRHAFMTEYVMLCWIHDTLGEIVYGGGLEAHSFDSFCWQERNDSEFLRPEGN